MAEIHSLKGEEWLDTIYSLNCYAFHPSPPYYIEKEEYFKIVRERQGVTYHALFEEGTALAGAASTAMTQNIRGKLYPASGVWGVSTHPGGRRKGFCARVMASLLAAEHESGKVFSNLYPFRESFYERMGYTTLPLSIIARLNPASLAPLLKQDFGGEVELQMVSQAYDDYRDYIAEMRRSVHGMAIFDVGDRFQAGRNRFWVAFARFNGKREGVMLYNLSGDEVTHFSFNAGRFYYRTARARYLLLEWIARHTDQADRVEIWLAPTERPETWLADLQLKLESPSRAPMSRVLSVARLGGMSAGEGAFTAQIEDTLCPFNSGIWRFTSHSGELHVSAASQADCHMTIQGLSGLILGTHDPQDFIFRGWGNPSSELQSVMRGMFPAQTPFLHENF